MWNSLGELRHAVAMAQQARDRRDKLLYGEEPEGGTYEAQCLVVQQHFADEASDFELPVLEIDFTTNRMLIEGVCVCEDIRKFTAADSVRINKRREAIDKEAVAATEKEHGAQGLVLGPPKLALLYVRELHRQGHECAAGEADPGEVASKMLMAMGSGDAEDEVG